MRRPAWYASAENRNIDSISNQIHTYTELRQQIYHDPWLSIIVALGIPFWIWFGVLAYHAPRESYPYYDTQKSVPQWSELTPLEGNHKKGGEYR
ncbi:MAG TPA: hypothetical protein VLQ29_09110 [Candidatus Dormibacteraeota bacterium]|nr:hypothetical protein [Candidatus Dormibacteraeota bacterium]